MYTTVGRNLVLEEILLRRAIKLQPMGSPIKARGDEIVYGLLREWDGFDTDPADFVFVPKGGFWRELELDEYE